MDHGEHALAAAATDLHSTFEGHVLPGSMFILWALIWLAQRLSRSDAGGGATLESVDPGNPPTGPPVRQKAEVAPSSDRQVERTQPGR